MSNKLKKTASSSLKTVSEILKLLPDTGHNETQLTSLPAAAAAEHCASRIWEHFSESDQAKGDFNIYGTSFVAAAWCLLAGIGFSLSSWNDLPEDPLQALSGDGGIKDLDRTVCGLMGLSYGSAAHKEKNIRWQMDIAMALNPYLDQINLAADPLDVRLQLHNSLHALVLYGMALGLNEKVQA